jgi:mono/diheme cytochrome c family protein
MRASILLLALGATAGAAVTAEPTKEQLEFFESKVRPILADRCYSCHSLEQGKSKGGLTLDTKPGWEKGGAEGPVVKPGDVEGSLLVKAIGYQDPDLQMPPKGEKLTDAQIATLTEWVKMGAPDPRAVRQGSDALGLSASGQTGDPIQSKQYLVQDARRRLHSAET